MSESDKGQTGTLQKKCRVQQSYYRAEECSIIFEKKKKMQPAAEFLEDEKEGSYLSIALFLILVFIWKKMTAKTAHVGSFLFHHSNQQGKEGIEKVSDMAVPGSSTQDHFAPCQESIDGPDGAEQGRWACRGRCETCNGWVNAVSAGLSPPPARRCNSQSLCGLFSPER